METIRLRVEGMSCDHCVRAVERAIQDVAGVSDVTVNLPAKEVSVRCDSSIVNTRTLVGAIEDAGYTVVE